MLLYFYKHNNNDYSEEKKKKKQSKIYLFPAAMLGITATAGMIANIPGANADDNPAIDDTINITVDSSCTMGQTVLQGNESLNPGGTKVVGSSRIAAYCNDNEGYAIYAIGYTNGEYGNTNLVSTDGNHTIPTGTSGNNSYWNMKLTSGTATGTTSYLPTMVNEFTTSTTIPNDYTKVAYRDSSTISQNQDPTETGSYFTTTYAAHVSTTQPAGIYTGQVQYVMVHPAGAPAPEIPNIGQLTYLQDFARLTEQEKASIIKNTGTEVVYTLKDQRDNQDYTVAKLRDGKIWMTKNLNLAGGAEINSELSDVPDGYVLPTANNFQSGNRLPDSDTYGFNNSAKAFVYNSTKVTGADCSSPGCYSYYSWTAATAGSGLEISTKDTDTLYSICPKGWKLPNSRSTVVGNSDFYQLAVAYGMNPSSTAGYGSDFYSHAGLGTVPNFVFSGRYDYGPWFGNYDTGFYWSSTSAGTSSALRFWFMASQVVTNEGVSRLDGYAVRCIVK